MINSDLHYIFRLVQTEKKGINTETLLDRLFKDETIVKHWYTLRLNSRSRVKVTMDKGLYNSFKILKS